MLRVIEEKPCLPYQEEDHYGWPAYNDLSIVWAFFAKSFFGIQSMDDLWERLCTGPNLKMIYSFKAGLHSPCGTGEARQHKIRGVGTKGSRLSPGEIAQGGTKATDLSRCSPPAADQVFISRSVGPYSYSVFLGCKKRARGNMSCWKGYTMYFDLDIDMYIIKSECTSDLLNSFASVLGI